MKVDQKAIQFVFEFLHVNESSASIGNDYKAVQSRHSLQYRKPISDKSFKSLLNFFFTHLTVGHASTKLHKHELKFRMVFGLSELKVACSVLRKLLFVSY